MFHRKIHPENSIAEREFNKSRRCKTIGNSSDGYRNGDLTHTTNNNRRFPWGSKSKEGILCYENNSELPKNGLNVSNSIRNGEHWIKTDADCKYHHHMQSQYYKYSINLRT